MIWSFSEGRTFKACPRRWFYKAVFGESRSKDPQRREAYVLSKLQSIYAWRGQVVDSVISKNVVSDLNANRTPVLRNVLKCARQLFEMQREFGTRHRVREPDMAVTDAGPAFAAFHSIEYGLPLTDDDFDRAWCDVETAIRNLWKLEELRGPLREGRYRIAQRNLLFEHCGAKVRAVPDLVVFFADRPPLIVDWKVHSYGTRDYADQLATYALALIRVAPHSDFPTGLPGYAAHEIELVEAQLLLGTARKHTLTPEAFQSAEERIAEGIMTLDAAIDGRRSNELCADDFPAARNPQSCAICPFKKLCWN